MSEEQEKAVQMSLGERIENFWYHYKWHTVVALFLIIAIIICTFQMCSKESFDSYVLYAGGYGISRVVGDDVAEYTLFLSSLNGVTPDRDGDGYTNTSFLDLYIPSSDEIKESGNDLYALMSDNMTRLQYELISGGDYYLCFLSPENYDEYKVWDGVTLFMPLAPYVPEGTDAEYYDESAIYLKSTAFASSPGFKNLPDDTLIVLRVPSAVASFFDRGDNERKFEDAEELLKNILSYK